MALRTLMRFYLATSVATRAVRSSPLMVDMGATTSSRLPRLVVGDFLFMPAPLLALFRFGFVLYRGSLTGGLLVVVSAWRFSPWFLSMRIGPTFSLRERVWFTWLSFTTRPRLGIARDHVSVLLG